MLTKRIIPCLDCKDGRVVKGVQFEDLKDAGNPVELSEFYSKNGADELTVLDISASVNGRETQFNLIKEIAKNVFIPLTVGGGIKNLDDISKLLKCGADKISINSAAVTNPELVRQAAKKFGSQCIVVAIDVKKSGDSWEIFTHSGKKPTGLDAIKWANKMCDYGAGELLVTSMDEDGKGNGYDNEVLSLISKSNDIPIIASGGAGSLEHLLHAFVDGHADAVLAASIFHFKKYSISDVKHFLKQHNISVRI